MQSLSREILQNAIWMKKDGRLLEFCHRIEFANFAPACTCCSGNKLSITGWHTHIFISWQLHFWEWDIVEHKKDFYQRLMWLLFFMSFSTAKAWPCNFLIQTLHEYGQFPECVTYFPLKSKTTFDNLNYLLSNKILLFFLNIFLDHRKKTKLRVSSYFSSSFWKVILD